MKKKIKYTNGPIGRTKLVEDFLPSPAELMKAEVNVKVTLNLSLTSLNYFKKLSKKSGIPYQKIIRNLLRIYVLRATTT